jgi:Tol biopolymer transport system component
MQRFEREAQVLASLNHPNIAAIYGIEQGAIVMELVEGEDLKGPHPVETSIGYARQIAAGLEAAHEKGIVHRDLKPANIKVTHDGVVKLLDFGLAKTTESASASSASASPTLSPTLSLAMTQAGMILGTAGYMSPEQARGKPVDKRCDIWAFGVVLFELLTGKPLFAAGETVTDVIAAVVTREPDWKALPAETPAHIRRLLERCLRKDPKLRLRDIGEARIALDEAPVAVAPATQTPTRRAILPWAIAALLALVLAALGAVAWLRPKPSDPVTMRFVLPWPQGTTEPLGALPQVAVSPDGRNLAMIATGADGSHALWVRPIGSVSAHRLDKTEGAGVPFWSPDSQFIAFFADEKLKKIPAAGGPPQTLCDAPGSGGPPGSGDGGTWNLAGVIVFSTGADSPLMRVLANGGQATPVTKLDTAAGENRHSWPQFLPDGRHLLYFAGNGDQNKSAIYVQELGSAARVLVMRNRLRGEWAPPGYLLFPREGTLFAQPMDPNSFQLSGEPASVAEGINSNEPSGRASYNISGGVLVYRATTGLGIAQLAWYGRDGERRAAVGKPAAYTSVRMSPDDRSAAVSIGSRSRSDVWILDLATGGLRRMTNNGQSTFVLGPWSPDAQRLAVNLSYSRGVLEVAEASGKTRPLGPAPLYANDWSPDGQFLFCTDVNGDHWSLLQADGSQRVQGIPNISFRGTNIRFAPDGKLVAYLSNESGRFEVMVASFPSFAERRQVSISGGARLFWLKQGNELLFQALDGTIMSTVVRVAGGKIEASVPKPLFKLPPSPGGSGSFRYWSASDGQRFLVMERDPGDVTETTVVLNWAPELKQ